MPEMPEVETVRRQLSSQVEGTTIASIERLWPPALVLREDEMDKILAQVIRSLERRGKYLLFKLDQGFLVFHLRMTGRLYVTDQDAVLGEDRWIRLILNLKGGQRLVFSDARKFGRCFFLSQRHLLDEVLGPEPLALREEDWLGFSTCTKLRKSKRPLKTLLLDQHFLAGLGNIYVDESLFRAGLSPFTQVRDLTGEDWLGLGRAIQSVLLEALDHEGSTIGWYRTPEGKSGSQQEHFLVYQRQGHPCVRCGATLAKGRLSGRGTHFCFNCQPRVVAPGVTVQDSPRRK
jgi:formamidopyrimidine-DNA glycosylase